MKRTLLTIMTLVTGAVCALSQVPLVYDVENTAAGNPDPVFPSFSELPYIEPLTDPFEYSDGSGRVTEFKDWSRRRGEIAREIQHYEIGDKPTVSMDDIEASMNGNTLTVKVTVNGKSLTLTSTISYPAGGQAPYPLMIGADNNSLSNSFFTSRNIATMSFTASQVNGYSQFGGSGARGSHPIDNLYPELVNNGAYSHWAWGFSRLLDGLQKLGPEVTKIDMAHIGVTGCSYAGKMALFCGAFDERVALTIAQEPGGGGANAWRVSRVHNRDYTKEDAWENLDNTDYSWFMQSLKDNFSQDKTFRLPYDHHELVALCCPRAVLLLGNPSQKWLGDGSGYVSMNAARKVWKQFGVEDRCGYSIIGGHNHCQLPASQNADVEAYLDRFLLGNENVNTVIMKAPDYVDGGANATALVELGQWMDWWGGDSIPRLPNGKPDAALFFGNYAQVDYELSDFVLEDDPTAPGGKSFRATVDNATYPVSKDKAIKFTFNVKTKQNFYIYTYVNCAKSANDAFYIAFDDNTPMVSNGASTRGDWQWKSLQALLGATDKTAFVKNLAPGEHTAYIYAKEAGAKIGLICVSNIETLNEFKPAVENFNLQELVTLAETVNGTVTAVITAQSDGACVKILVNVADKFDGSVELYSLSGVKMTAMNMSLPAGQSVITLPVAIEDGTYFIRLTDRNGRMFQSKPMFIR